MRTSKKRVEGTAHWMSPETMSKGVYNRMSDVYSFSMTIYEVRFGFPVFDHQDAELNSQDLHRPPTIFHHYGYIPLSARRGSLGAPLSAR